MNRTFIAVIEIVLAGNGAGTGEYDVGAGNEFEIQRIQQSSTGIFDVTDITDQTGNRYTNASVSKPLNGQLICDVEADNNNNADLPHPITVISNGTIRFTLLDTSTSANTVRIFLTGILRQKTG